MIQSMKTCSRTWQISGHICDQNGCKLESCFNMTHLSGSGGRGLWRLSSSLQFILPTLLLSSLLLLYSRSTALKPSSNPLYHCLSSSLPVSPPRSAEDTFCPHFTHLCLTVCLPLLHCCLKNPAD